MSKNAVPRSLMKQRYDVRKFLDIGRIGLPNYKARAIRPGGYAQGGPVAQGSNEPRGSGCASKGCGKGKVY